MLSVPFVGLCPALKKYLLLKKQDILKKKERSNHPLEGKTAKLTNPNRTKHTTIITQTTLPSIKKNPTPQIGQYFFRRAVPKQFL